MCVNKKNSPMLPQAVYVSSGETPGLNAHRVRRVTDRSYAVVAPTSDSAAGRAEETSFCHTTFALCANVV